MANNVTIGGYTIATNDISSVHYQLGKITFGVDGVATLVSSSDPLPVALASLPALPAGSNHIGKVGGATAVVAVTLSTDTSAFASGDVLADTQIVDAALRVTNGTGLLQSVVVIDQSDQKAALTLYFLSSNVAMGTENSAPSISDANALHILGFVDVAVADYKDLGGVSVANIRGVNIPLVAASGTDDIYVAAVNGTGTPTYAADGLRLRLGILQD